MKMLWCHDLLTQWNPNSNLSVCLCVFGCHSPAIVLVMDRQTKDRAVASKDLVVSCVDGGGALLRHHLDREDNNQQQQQKTYNR